MEYMSDPNVLPCTLRSDVGGSLKQYGFWRIALDEAQARAMQDLLLQLQQQYCAWGTTACPVQLVVTLVSLDATCCGVCFHLSSRLTWQLRGEATYSFLRPAPLTDGRQQQQRGRSHGVQPVAPACLGHHG
jgi:hypothetical protein